jgi:hypothetical protein
MSNLKYYQAIYTLLYRKGCWRFITSGQKKSLTFLISVFMLAPRYAKLSLPKMISIVHGVKDFLSIVISDNGHYIYIHLDRKTANIRLSYYTKNDLGYTYYALTPKNLGELMDSLHIV